MGFILDGDLALALLALLLDEEEDEALATDWFLVTAFRELTMSRARVE